MRRRPALLLAAACLMAHAAAVLAEEDLEQRVWELRRSGDYEQALEVARHYRSSLSGADPPAVEAAADADRLIATVAAVLDLPSEGRRAVTRADSLRQAVLDGFGDRAYERCLTDLARELALRREWQGSVHVDVARSLYIQGRLQAVTGDHAGAEASLVEAAAVQRQVLGAGHSATARTLQYLADYRFRAEDFTAARELLEEVVETYETLYGRGAPATFGALDYLASVTDLLGEERRAAAMREECARLTRDHYGDDSPETASILRRLARSYEKSGRLAESVATYEESLAILRRAGESESSAYANGLTGLAVVVQRQGDLSRAEALYSEALVLARRTLGERHLDVAAFLGNVAFLATAQGRYARGAEIYREALSIQREHLPPTSLDIALTLDNLAALERDRGRLESAAPLYEEALTIRREALGDRHADVARSLNHVAEARLDQGELGAAAENLGESLAIRIDLYGDDHPMIAVALANLARLARLRAQWAAADSLLETGLELRRRWLGPRHPDVGRDLLALAEVRWKRGRSDEAAVLLTEAVEVYESARRRAGEGLTRATAKLANPYRLQATLALERDDPATAWTAVEKLRARALTDLLAAGRRRDMSASELAREDSLRRELRDSEQRLLASREAGPTADVENRRLHLEHEAAEAAWATFQQELAHRHPQAASRVRSPDDVAARLGARTALIGWFDAAGSPGEGVRWSYLVTARAGLRWIRLPAPSDTTRVAAHLRRLLRDPHTPPAAWQEAAGRVWSERFAPLVDRLADIDGLVVVPGDALLGVPVEVLLDPEGVPLGDRFQVSYAPSATALVWLREERADQRLPAAPHALLLGDPPYRQEHLAAVAADTAATRGVLDLALAATSSAATLDDSLLAALPRLSATRTEVTAIADLLPDATVLLSADASEQEMVQRRESGELAAYDLIHLATHALVDDERPARSALVLARTGVDDPLARALTAGRVYDGLLTADEIVGEWDLHAELVVLSACETGLGRKVAGEGYIGFTHAFLQAGARAVLVSLWPVDDRSTALLMTRFYENLLGSYQEDRGNGPGVVLDAPAALAEAKRHLRQFRHRGRRAFAHPFYWSPFILIGAFD